MPITGNFPSLEQLVDQPELGALVILEGTLDAVYDILANSHPGWGRCPNPFHSEEARCGPVAMIRIMVDELREDVAQYLADYQASQLQATDDEQLAFPFNEQELPF